MEETEKRYKQAKELYERCKKLFWEDSYFTAPSILEFAETYEEKEFYVTVSNLFLQQEQKKVIQKGVF